MSEVNADIAERIHAKLHPEPAPEPTPEPAPDPEPTPEPTEQATAVDDGSTVEAPQEATAEPEETLELETLTDLAEHFNIEPSDLFHLKIPVEMDDGTRSEITIEEYKDSFRAQQVSERTAREAAAQREALEAQKQELEAKYQQEIANVAATLSVAEKQLMQDFEAVQWDQLRADDPAEWAARRQLFNERNAALQQAKAELAETWQATRAEQVRQAEQHRAEALGREHEALLQAIPEWADEDAAKLGRAELASYLGTSGFSQDEVNQVVDHRLVVMARKAMLYDQQVSKADAAKKRVVRIGKRTVAPGAARAKQTAAEDRDAKLKQNLKKTGSVEDLAAVIRSRMGN